MMVDILDRDFVGSPDRTLAGVDSHIALDTHLRTRPSQEHAAAADHMLAGVPDCHIALDTRLRTRSAHEPAAASDHSTAFLEVGRQSSDGTPYFVAMY